LGLEFHSASDFIITSKVQLPRLGFEMAERTSTVDYDDKNSPADQFGDSNGDFGYDFTSGGAKTGLVGQQAAPEFYHHPLSNIPTH
jgi:hypothetical protein